MISKVIVIQILFLSLSVFADTSYFPSKGIPIFIFENFDLHSIRSSFGPRLTKDKITLKDFGLKPTKVTEDTLEIRENNWYWKITLLEKKDKNKDGIEDLVICFLDQALKGTYHTQKPFLLSRYSKNGRVVALSAEQSHALCKSFK